MFRMDLCFYDIALKACKSRMRENNMVELAILPLFVLGSTLSGS